MKKFEVIQEVILERVMEVEAMDETEADMLISQGYGELIDEQEASWPTTITITEVTEDE